MSWPAGLRYFTPEEFGPAAESMDATLLRALDNLRDRLGRRILIHPDPTGAEGRVSDSQHPSGRAVDCHCPGLPLGDFWLAAEASVTFTGIGLYPAWTHPGLHLDVRPGVVRARWWRDADGAYRPVTAGVLYRLMVEHAFMA